VQKSEIAEGGNMRRTLNNIKRRQLAKRQLGFLITSFAAVTLAVLLVFALTPQTQESSANAALEVQAKQEATGGMASEQLMLSVGLGGDACFGLEVAEVIKKQGTDYPWSDISGLIHDYDLSIVNMEGPVCNENQTGGDVITSPIKGEPACLRGMADAGISAVSLANDRIMDYGLPGLQQKLDFLREQHLQAVGAGANLRLAQQPLVLQSQDGAKVAVVALNDTSEGSKAAGESSAGVCPADKDTISNVIRQGRKLAPYVIAYFHWGTVGSQEISDRQRELAHAGVEAGANLVVGSHPHVIQGLEIWRGVPIIYSLGNMVFWPKEDSGKAGLFAGCRFEAGSLVSLEIVPLHIEEGKADILTGDEAHSVLESLADSSPGVDLEIDTATQVAYLNL
jgi:poly-gamma-glutamate capsule biosynthesis protein CapA/YwtB (metallophosphatase superfamily)